MSTSLLAPETVAPEYFTLEIDRGRPTVTSLISSLVLHSAVVAFLATVHFTIPPPKPVEEADLSPTEVRINNKLYYVANISGLEAAKSPVAAPAPRAAASGTSGPPKLTIPKQPSIDAPKIAMQTPKLGLPDAPASLPEAPAPPPEPARPVIKREVARTFIPPEVKRSPIAERTLIQPLSPPDLIPTPVPLPSFRVMTPQLPRIPKPYVSPGRPNPPPPQQVAAITPMQMEIVSAPPAPNDFQAKLTLPRTPPPPAPAPKPIEGPPPVPAGEAANILSLNNRNLPVPERLIVPQGNIAQESGNNPNVGPSNTTIAANVAPANAAAPSQATASQTPFRPTNPSPNAGANTANATANGSGSAAGAGASRTASATATPARTQGVPNGSPTGTATSGTPAAQSGAASGNSAENGTATVASAAGNAAGRGATGSGTGAATVGSSNTGSTTAAIGGPANGTTGVSAAGAPGGSPVIATPGGGTGAGMGAGRAGQIITRPNGSYDTVVVQSSSLDQYPESRGLLTGRPIYSVYINAGGGRDWTLYFCVPNEKPPANNTNVVKIGDSGPSVKAPFATKLMRPAITLPSYEKYVLVHGYVNTDGNFEGLRIVRSIQPETDKALLSALAAWEFHAAMREGNPIRVEVLLSIPAKGL